MTEEQTADAEALRKKTYRPEEEVRGKARLTKEVIREIVEHKWIDLVSPYLDGLNTIEAEEKLKELPSVYDMLLEAQLDKAISIIRGEIEKIESPYDQRYFEGSDANFEGRQWGFKRAKQDILSKLKEVNNDE